MKNMKLALLAMGLMVGQSGLHAMSAAEQELNEKWRKKIHDAEKRIAQEKRNAEFRIAQEKRNAEFRIAEEKRNAEFRIAQVRIDAEFRIAQERIDAELTIAQVQNTLIIAAMTSLIPKVGILCAPIPSLLILTSKGCNDRFYADDLYEENVKKGLISQDEIIAKNKQTNFERNLFDAAQF